MTTSKNSDFTLLLVHYATRLLLQNLVASTTPFGSSILHKKCYAFNQSGFFRASNKRVLFEFLLFLLVNRMQTLHIWILGNLSNGFCHWLLMLTFCHLSAADWFGANLLYQSKEVYFTHTSKRKSMLRQTTFFFSLLGVGEDKSI